MERIVDLRSDTVTKPCQEMRNIIANAKVGDDVYGEDPTLQQLEKIAAEKFEKEAALFVPSGTMGNQVAVLTHTERGDEVILEASSHIYSFEVGGIALMAGVLPNPIKGEYGKIAPEQLRKAIKPYDIHFAQPTLLCLENTSNFGGGTVYSVEEMQKLITIAKENGLKVHIDGARIFNAAVYLGVSVSQLVKEADSVMFCLSKGLGAPVGSMLLGRKDFINRARKYRKMLGGGIRQGGILAAAGIYALENLVERLADDHALAKKLAKGLNDIPGINIDLDNLQTNIIMADIAIPQLTAKKLVNLLKDNGILVNSVSESRIRFVTHRDVKEQDIDYTLEVINNILSKL